MKISKKKLNMMAHFSVKFKEAKKSTKTMVKKIHKLLILKQSMKTRAVFKNPKLIQYKYIQIHKSYKKISIIIMFQLIHKTKNL